jgi:hypothetical protein
VALIIMSEAIDIDFLKRLEVATTLDANNVSPILFQLLGQRKMVAQQLLRSGGSDEKYRETIELYNYLNENIKQVIGL